MDESHASGGRLGNQFIEKTSCGGMARSGVAVIRFNSQRLKKTAVSEDSRQPGGVLMRTSVNAAEQGAELLDVPHLQPAGQQASFPIVMRHGHSFYGQDMEVLVFKEERGNRPGRCDSGDARPVERLVWKCVVYG